MMRALYQQLIIVCVCVCVCVFDVPGTMLSTLYLWDHVILLKPSEVSIKNGRVSRQIQRPLPCDSRVRHCKPSLACSEFPSSQFLYLFTECHLESFQKHHSSNLIHSLTHHQEMYSLTIWFFPSNHIGLAKSHLGYLMENPNDFLASSLHMPLSFPSYEPKRQQNNFILLSSLAASPLLCFSSQHSSWKDFCNTRSFQSPSSSIFLNQLPFDFHLLSIKIGLPRWHSGKESSCWFRRYELLRSPLLYTCC